MRLTFRTENKVLHTNLSLDTLTNECHNVPSMWTKLVARECWCRCRCCSRAAAASFLLSSSARRNVYSVGFRESSRNRVAACYFCRYIRHVNNVQSVEYLGHWSCVHEMPGGKSAFKRERETGTERGREKRDYFIYTR